MHTDLPSHVVVEEARPVVGLGTVLGFLLGHRHSVLAVARCPGALIVGALFVLGAAFARHWDEAITLGNLISPYLISLATALLVFSIVRGTVRLGEAPMSSFPSFLGVYWMTAPLAWLYAIPVETFLSEYDATVVNLLLLLAVAAWRVSLMVRATAVVLGGPTARALVTVLLGSEIILLPVFWSLSGRLIDIMGGLRSTDRASMDVVARTADALYASSALMFPVLFVYWCGLVAARKPSKFFGYEEVSPRISALLWLFACASAGAWWTFSNAMTTP